MRAFLLPTAFLHFDPLDFGPAPVAYAISVSDSAPVVIIANPVIGDDYEARSPVLLLEANAAEQRDK
jgi:hypothetical protein